MTHIAADLFKEMHELEYALRVRVGGHCGSRLLLPSETATTIRHARQRWYRFGRTCCWDRAISGMAALGSISLVGSLGVSDSVVKVTVGYTRPLSILCKTKFYTKK